ncbi:RNA polymerase II transcription factor B subunit 4 [Glomus cerebriforme]|uniref:General transcription and DNA repair factor IIH subunit TFB4 n=1 Tax=Glomus cerebriforme TaxID=658196 RepID=A0A397STI7_9GLOM|nr:RNA polymerase II transcription factor B subunit 4 [Glomus cerebriforme]
MSVLKDTATVNEDDANLLVLIIDTNPLIWTRSAKSTGLSLKEALRHLLVFINAHLALKHDNEVAVIASHVDVSKFLFPIPTPPRLSEDTDQVVDSNLYQRFKVVNDQVIGNMKDLFEDITTLNSYPDKASSMIAGALSMALCYINRIMRADEIGHIKPRILIISISPDSPYQYISIMNCIFSAQKLGIPIDVCKVHGEDTVFLKQAAHITGGRYLKLQIPQGFLQFLMITFLPDRFTRNYQCLPGEEKVDFSASCFCHKKMIDIGYVCSVCLSIFCHPLEQCSTCRTNLILASVNECGLKLVNGIKKLDKAKGRESGGST